MNNEIPPEIQQDLKEKNKIDASRYDEFLKKKKDSIIEYYKQRVINISEYESVIEIMCETMEKFEIDATDMANILKEDMAILTTLKMDCMSRNMLKEKDKHVEIGDLFND